MQTHETKSSPSEAAAFEELRGAFAAFRDTDDDQLRRSRRGFPPTS